MDPTHVNDSPVKMQLHRNTFLHNIHPKLKLGYKRPLLHREEIHENLFHLNSMKDIDQKFSQKINLVQIQYRSFLYVLSEVTSEKLLL